RTSRSSRARRMTARWRGWCCAGTATGMVSGCVSGARLGAPVRGRTSARSLVPTIRERPLGRRRRVLAAAAVISCLGAPLSAQGGGDLFERFNLDKLQLQSLGAGAGRIFPSQVMPTTIFAFGADYGEIAPAWHVIFGVTYWESRFRDEVVQ